jgi:hypothetical protein
MKAISREMNEKSKIPVKSAALFATAFSRSPESRRVFYVQMHCI